MFSFFGKKQLSQFEIYSNCAVENALSFNIKLDYSNQSIEQVEKILIILHDTLSPEVPEEKISEMANMYGCYVGETLRRNLKKGTWELPASGPTQGSVSLTIEGNQILFPSKVYRNIINGSEDSIVQLYQLIYNQNSINQISLNFS